MTNNNDKLKKMMEEAASAKNDSKAQQEISNKVSPKKKWPWLVGSLALIAIVGGIAFAAPRLGNTQHLDKTPVASKNTTDVSFHEGDDDSNGNVISPIHLEKWQTEPVDEQTQTKAGTKFLNKGLDEWAKSDITLSGITNNSFASGSGITDDTTKAYNKGGKLNLNYSYLTTTNVNRIYTKMINRLINPVFGGWYADEFNNTIRAKGDYSLSVLTDMFTNDWINKNIVPMKDYSKIPIYADWNSDNYGNTAFKYNDWMTKDKKITPRWVGQVTKEKIVPNTGNDGQLQSIDVTANIKYSAYAKNGSIMAKNGILTLNLVQNKNGKNNPEYRLLINQSSLTVH